MSLPNKFLLAEARTLFNQHPSLRRYTWRPLAVSMVVFLIVAIGVIYSIGQFTPILAGWFGITDGWLLLLVRLALTAAIGIGSGILFLTIAMSVGGFFWGPLAKQIFKLKGVDLPSVKLSLPAIIVDVVSRICFAVFYTIAAIISGIFLPVVIPAAINGFLARYDFTAPAYAELGILFKKQRAIMKTNPERNQLWFTFSVTSIFPYIQVFFLPLLVAAGTLAVIRGLPSNFSSRHVE